jgi:isoquinoline 1-oxidoreductase beta subunit
LKLIWSREDDIKGGYYRPSHVHRAELGLDAKGRSSRGTTSSWASPSSPHAVRSLDGEGWRRRHHGGRHGRAVQVPLNLSAHTVKANVPVLWWRSVGSTHTAFVMETLIDEAAHAAKMDPVAYRKQLIGKTRHIAALDWRWPSPATARRSCRKGRPGAWPCMNRSTP